MQQTEQQTEGDTQAGDQPGGDSSESYRVDIIDLRGMPSHKIRRFRFVTSQVWFPEQREQHVDRRFYTRI